MTYADANLFQRLLRRFAASGPGSWLFARMLDHVDRPVHRLTKGRHTFASLASGQPVVMITTTGARRAQIWETGLRVYPGWAQYEKRASHREIVVFVLERRELFKRNS